MNDVRNNPNLIHIITDCAECGGTNYHAINSAVNYYSYYCGYCSANNTAAYSYVNGTGQRVYYSKVVHPTGDREFPSRGTVRQSTSHNPLSDDTTDLGRRLSDRDTEQRLSTPTSTSLHSVTGVPTVESGGDSTDPSVSHYTYEHGWNRGWEYGYRAGYQNAIDQLTNTLHKRETQPIA